MATVTGTVVMRGIGRSFADIDDVTSPADRRAWLEIPIALALRTYQGKYGTIQIEADWSEVAIEMQRQSKYTTREFVALSVTAQKRATASKRVVRIPFRLSGSSKHVSDAVMRYFLYEAFLIMNLACPGTFSANQIEIEDERYGRPIAFRSELFEDAWIWSVRSGWPPIEPLSVKHVAEWYRAIVPDVTEIGTTRLPKALFSLLHASNLSDTEPTLVLWLAQCLESLFDVPTALSRKILQERAFLLLGAPKSAKAVAKDLREFFDARNAFAHGGADVSHPIGSALSDVVIEQLLEKWQRPAEFATSIIMAALQYHAKHSWREVTWTEAFVPVMELRLTPADG